MMFKVNVTNTRKGKQRYFRYRIECNIYVFDNYINIHIYVY